MEKISKLLFALLDRTKNGAIAWRETADEDIFQCSFADSTINIGDFGASFSISIFNGDGRVIDLVSDAELDRAVPLNSFEEISNHRLLMERLYSAARRKALKADATVDGILSQLGVEA